MENYIIRIYRRDRRSPWKIVGLVESVEAGMKRAFSDLDQMREIIAAGKAAKSSRRRTQKKPANRDVDHES